MRFFGTIALVVSGWAGISAEAIAQAHEDQVNDAAQTLREIMAVPLKGIPEALLHDAQGIAIIPGMVKGGFIIGVRHGKGVLVSRDDSGAWRAPVFITLTGGSAGFQAGLQATDLVLVFKTRRSVEGILRGKLAIGADASVAAGPVGRQASAATDAQLKAEILSYSRSRGLFAGLAIDGAVLHIDHRANSEYYAPRPGQPPGTIPASAGALVHLVAASATQSRPMPAVVPAPKEVAPPPPVPAPDEREVVRQQLVTAAQRLQPLLEPAWQQYLALPAELFTGQAFAAGTTLDPNLRRYQAVASDSRYRALNERMEFQETHALLRRYAGLLQPRPTGLLSLPPPPGN
jgi:lipid-binding SYLF domain-containing protein